MNTIIHIASDEKFINSAYWQFNQIYPDQNIFYILVDDINADLKYVNFESNMVLIRKDIKEVRKLHKCFKQTNLVCFHGLDYYNSVIANNLPNKFITLWFLWGFELYGNPLIQNQNESLGEKTKVEFSYATNYEGKTNKVKGYFREVYYSLKNGTKSPLLEMKNAIRKVDYCGILYKEEFQNLKNTVSCKLKFIQFCYYPIELMLANPKLKVNSNNILLGNSASPSNNHLEAIDVLVKLDLGSIKVVTPLSYGSKEYREAIELDGSMRLNTNFLPIVDFMPLHEYNAYLQQCGIVIMNHYRQQAVGNVLTMLWMGAKVYLDERNTLYHYLKRIGIHVFSVLKDLHINNSSCLENLTKDQQIHNQEILQKEISQQVLLSNLKSQIDKLI